MRAMVGVDEAGRGPWAGPVVAAAVCLEGPAPQGLGDSKTLSAARRAALFDALPGVARIGVGIASVAEIDGLNILRATDLAMRRALEDLGWAGPCLVDGNRLPPGIAGEAVVRGDATVPAISAASIVAKVTRDRLMTVLAAEHPGYGWQTNMGYGTAAHRAAIGRLGVTVHHRRSFRPIAQALLQESLRTS